MQIGHLRVRPHKRTQVLVLVAVEDDRQLQVPEPPRHVVEHRPGHLEPGVPAHIVDQREHRRQVPHVAVRRVAGEQVRDELLRDAPLEGERRVLLDDGAPQDVDLLGVVALPLGVPHAVGQKRDEGVRVAVRASAAGAARRKAQHLVEVRRVRSQQLLRVERLPAALGTQDQIESILVDAVERLDSACLHFKNDGSK